MADPTWRDLYEFINKEIDKDPEFLNNQLYIEMVGSHNASFKQIEDCEGWRYIQPAWSIGKQVHILTTTFPRKKIVTLNINF